MRLINFLILSLFTLICVSCDKKPIQYIYIPDLKLQTCAKWKVPDAQDGKFTFVAYVDPLKNCDGNISIRPDDVPKTKNWVQDHCK